MTDIELMDYIVQNDIEVPDDLLDSAEFSNSVRYVFQASPRSCYSYYLTQDIIDGIQDLIDTHQGATQESAQRQSGTTTRATAAHTLENNLVWYNGQWSSTGGDWSSSYANYNCYSFAIGKTNERYRYPGQHSGVSMVPNYMSLYSISQMATFVKNDLDALGGYGDVYVSSSEPSNIQPWQTLICIRKGSSDYHFMKYDKTTLAWHHKPGGTAPLKYLHHPADITWVSEYSSSGVCWNADDQLAMGWSLTTYNSAVYYITYGEHPFTTSTSGLPSNQIAITGVKSGATLPSNLVIPEQLNGRIVTQIGNAAFIYQGNLTSVTIPDSVTSIGVEAFKSCSSLESISFGSGSQLANIGNAAFIYCGNLASITIPDSVTSIGANAFQSCSLLKNVYFNTGSTLTNIGNSAFAYCGTLSYIYIPIGVNIIGTETFRSCSSLSFITFDANSTLSSIQNAAFAYCGKLSNITFPSSLISIGTEAFKNCKLTYADFQSATGLSTIQNAAFAYSMLRNIVIPSSLTSIGYDAFLSCADLTSITIPNNVTTIGGNAFANCTSLTIYTSRATSASGWITGWNSSARPVVWNCSLLQYVTYYVTSFTKTSFNPSSLSGIQNPYRYDYTFEGWYTATDFSGTQYMDLATAPNVTLYAKWNKPSCIAEGTLITLADGSQVEVENLTGNESLLVWNLFTGTFDAAPILFIDSDPYAEYEIIHLYFSDGTEVKVIYEHAFWDIDLNEYVFLRSDAARYIGHWFNKQTNDGNGNMVWTAVQLTDVQVYTEYITAWSPVTYGHLCYYVNGMLSMPGATEGLINIFEVNAATMQYDTETFAADIAAYGLFTYEEFAEIIPIPEVIFEAFNGQYLKVSIGKGLIDINGIISLIERYADFF